MLENLKKGIKLLLNYETKEGGFEWFGSSPGHSTLSAYGLWQFSEIEQLNMQLFDSSLFERLKEFFDKVQKKEGGFIIREGLDELGNPDQNTSDLYVSLMLLKKYPDFATQYKEQLAWVLSFKDKIFTNELLDSYKMALIGLFLAQLERKSEAEKILELILKRQNDKGMITRGENSITNSTGDYLDIETTALFLILLMEINHSKYFLQLEKGISFIVKSFKQGRFGSTQGTILSLKVFDNYFDLMEGGESQKFEVEVSIDQSVYEVAHFDKSLSSEVQCFRY